MESMFLLLFVVGLFTIVLVGIIVVKAVARGRSIAVRDTSDDEKKCMACGSIDIVEPAPGVYICACGYEGGPGIGDYQWKTKCDNIAGQSEERRREMLNSSTKRARDTLKIASSDLHEAARLFAQGDAIIPLSKGAVAEKTALFENVRALLPDVQENLLEAIADVELARHIVRGDGPMSEWYEKLNGSREGLLTLTGIQASAALKTEIQEYIDFLSSLECELQENVKSRSNLLAS